MILSLNYVYDVILKGALINITSAVWPQLTPAETKFLTLPPVGSDGPSIGIRFLKVFEAFYTVSMGCLGSVSYP